jgi:hypothetical protein
MGASPRQETTHRARLDSSHPKQMTRAVRWYCHQSARCRYLALCDMNSAPEAKRQTFQARVERAMAAF